MRRGGNSRPPQSYGARHRRCIECCGDKGYECKEEWVTLTDESVTTEQGDFGNSGRLGYSTQITADTIKVTFNGTEYTCDKVLRGEVVAYGGVGEQSLDFSEYPFVITSFSAPENANFIYTETAGTYQVKIETVGESVETSECFKKAVLEAAKSLNAPLVLDIDSDQALDKTFAEIKAAYLSGRSVLLDPVNPTPILRDASVKSYFSMTQLSVALPVGNGGNLVFGSNFIQTFTASSDDDYPTLVV